MLQETKSTKLAVIITTHYIDETKQAHKIGLMRKGVLLAQDSPNSLLNAFNTTSLEDAFLKLCLQQGSDEVQENNETDTKTPQIKDASAVTHPDVLVHNNDMNSNNNKHTTSNGAVTTITESSPSPMKIVDPKKTVVGSDEFKNGISEKMVYRDATFGNDLERRSSIIEKIKFTTKTKMKALLAKNFVQMIRQPA